MLCDCVVMLLPALDTGDAEEHDAANSNQSSHDVEGDIIAACCVVQRPWKGRHMFTLIARAA